MDMLRYLWLSFARHAGSFARSERGNFAMMFAVMSVPLMVAVGGVIDYSRASSARTEMQDALDATSLALSRQANVDTMTTAQMQTFATNYFNANFNTGNVINLTVSPSYSSTGPSVTVAGAATVKTTFLNLIGMTGVPINATSTTIWGESRLRVALVLDNTGSMADDGKMDALHTATHNLL